VSGPLATLDRLGPTLVARTRSGTASTLIRPRTLGVVVVLLAIVLALALVAIAVGSRWLPLPDLLAGLVGEGERAAVLTVQRFRLPRVVVAVLVGVALGVSGALVQAATRNPIAAPDVIGVSAGASFGAVAVLLAFGGATFGYGGASAELSRIGVPAGAVLGAFLAAAIVLGIGAGPHRGAGRSIGIGPSTQRIVLVGIVCHAAFIGLVHWGLASGDVDQATKATVWLVGSLHGRGWEHAAGVAIALAVLLPVLLVLARRLDVLALGPSSATTLGVPVASTQLSLFVVAFALAGTAVAAAGPVNFVALLAPQIAARLVRAPGVPLIASALIGAALVLAADLLARLAIPGTELPAGAVTALVGAPYLLWLVVRTGGRT
jgi:iron complex transport system permease protein